MPGIMSARVSLKFCIVFSQATTLTPSVSAAVTRGSTFESAFTFHETSGAMNGTRPENSRANASFVWSITDWSCALANAAA